MFHLLFWIFTSLMIMLVFQILEAGIAMLKIGAPVKLNTIALNFIPLLIILPIGACIFYASYFSFNFFSRRPIRFIWIGIGYLLYIFALCLPGYFTAKTHNVNIEPLRGFLSIVLIVAPVLYFNLFGFLLRTFIEWIKDKKIKAELEQDKLVSQIELLKSKINPHFLFNTINNIDVLIQKDPVKASDYLNKLSDIMRFMLYETKADKIALSTELSYLEKYIELQKIRSSNPSYVNYHVEGNIDGQLIEPMLFIPFMENAFKHTENKNIENAINIKLIINKEMIIFECENKFTINSQNISEHNGLGNDLIEKRLLLLYPNKHQLNITKENNTYKVKLTLNNVY